MPNVEVPAATLNIVDFLVDATKIEPSRRQAREDVQNGAIYINGERQNSLEFEVDPKAAFDGKFIIIRKGKKKYTLARVK